MEPYSREQAIVVAGRLFRQYGLKWTPAKVPASAWDEMAKCNEVLTEADRRKIARDNRVTS